jgi:nitroreductase
MREAEPESVAVAGTLDFAETVRRRHSARAFLPDPLPEAELLAVLEDAQRSPSNTNSQPWVVHVVSGVKRDELSRELLRAAHQNQVSLDFTYDPRHGGHEALLRHVHDYGHRYYDVMGIERDDVAARGRLHERNFEFFGAPHVAFLLLPAVGDCVRVAADVGMYAQTFLLSLTARGFAGIAQTSLGSRADVVREVLGVPADLKLLFGISFGFEDPDALANSFMTERVPLSESVVLHL